MIRAEIGEKFIIAAALWDETTGLNATAQTVYYDIRDENDNPLSPPLDGVLPESTVTSGVYKYALAINTPGEYICYITCSGFYSSMEEIIINSESIYEITKSSRNYNMSIEDITRTNSTPTASQIIRNVPLSKTDYIVTYVKNDSDADWSSVTVSGISYAWYYSTTDALPYKMGGNGL